MSVHAGQNYSYKPTAVDPEGQAVTLSLDSGPAGMSFDSATGTINWSTSTLHKGNHNVTIKATDTRGSATLQSYVMSVLDPAINRAPVFKTTPVVTANVNLEYQYPMNAIAPDGDTVQYSVAGVTGATITAGKLVWTPAPGQAGPQTITLTASDGTLSSDQIFVVNVGMEVGNSAPIITSSPKNKVAQGIAYQYHVVADDPDGDTLAYSLTGAPSGMLIDGTTGLITWPSPQPPVPTTPVVITVRDGRGGVTTQSLNLVLALANMSFTGNVRDVTGNQNVGLGSWTVYIDANRSGRRDPGEVFTTSAANGTYTLGSLLEDQYVVRVDRPTQRWIIDTPSTGQYIANLAVGNPGVVGTNMALADFKLIYNDGAINRSPIISPVADQTINPQQTLTVNINATDPDGDSLQFDLRYGQVGMVVDPNTGVFTWTPSRDWSGKSSNVIVAVTDPFNGVRTTSFKVNVATYNNPPVFTSTPITPATAGSAYSYRATAIDPEGATITYSLVSPPANMTINPGDGTVTWTNPAVSLLGQVQVTVRASDGLVTTDQVYSLAVVAPNQAPIITSKPSVTAKATQAYSYTVVASDPDVGDTVSISVPTKPAWLTYNSGTQTLSGTPSVADITPLGQPGTAVVVQVTDSRGASRTQSYNLLVLPTANTDPINRAPVFISGPATLATVDVRYVGTILVADEDVGDLIRVTPVGKLPAWLTLSPTPGQANSYRLVGTPNDTDVGPVTITLKATDQRGGSSTDSFDLRVVFANRAPVAKLSLPTKVMARTSLVGRIDATDPDGDPLTYTKTAGPTNMSIDGYGVIRWQPTDADIAGSPYALSFIVSDGKGHAVTLNQSLQVTSQIVTNHAPVITSPGPMTAAVGRTLEYQGTAIDEDGDAIWWRMVSGPEGAAIDPMTGLVKWTPAPHQAGLTQRFEIVATDLRLSTPQVFAVSVPIANRPPRIESSPPSTGSVGNLTTYGVRAIDPDGDPMTFSLAAPTLQGGELDPRTQGASIDAKGVVRFKPQTVGTFRFKIVVADDHNGSAAQEFKMTVSTSTSTNNRPPAFSRLPSLRAIAGQPYASTSVAVNANDKPSGNTSVAGTTLTEFDHLGRAWRTTDVNGLVTESTFDSRGLVIQSRVQTRNSSGGIVWNITRSIFDDAGRSTFTTSSFVEGTPFAEIYGNQSIYDDAGRVTVSKQLNGIRIDITGQAPNQTSTLVGTPTVLSQNTTNYKANTSGRVSSTVDSYGRVSESLYDAKGNTVQSRSRSYDESNNPVWLVQRTVYDSRGRVVFFSEPFVMPSTALATDPSPLLFGTETIYDDHGRSIGSKRIKDAVVSISSMGAGAAVVYSTVRSTIGTTVSSSSTVFDTRGRAYKEVSADGQESITLFDTRGRRAGSLGSAVPVASVGINNAIYAGKLVRLRTEIAYDTYENQSVSRSNVWQIENADGSQFNIDRTQQRETKFEFDQFGRNVKTVYADNSIVTATYDSKGNKLTETNQVGQTRTFEYDSSNRLKTVGLPAVLNPATGTMVNPRYEYGYDERGNQNLLRDPLGRETRWTFDALGREIERRLPVGLGPDGIQGTIDDSTIPEGTFAETRTYDPKGRIDYSVSFEGILTKNIYDDTIVGAGRVSEQWFFSNKTAYESNPNAPIEKWVHVFDAFGRERSITRTHVPSNSSITSTNTYDAESRLSKVQSAEGTVNYSYDFLGRMTATMVGDAANPARKTSYTYNGLGQLATVTEDLTPANTADPTLNTSYQYDILGNLKRTNLPNGAVEAINYDSMNRMTKMIDYGPDTTPADLSDNPKVAQYDYTLRDDGRKTQSIEKFWKSGQAGEFITNTLTYNYDGLNRLVQEKLDSSDNALDYQDNYKYDLTGNRLEKKHDVGCDGAIDTTTSYTYDANDRLIDELVDNLVGADNLNHYSYSKTQQTNKATYSGTTVSPVNQTTSMSFAYDLQGRLEVATTQTYSGGAVTRVDKTTYDYNANGIRVSALQEIDSNNDGTFETRTRTEFLNDANNQTGYSQVLRETQFNAITGVVIKQVDYSFGHDEISQTTKLYDANGNLTSTETLVFGHDGHGSVRVLMDIAGAMAQMFVYDAYGNMVSISNQAGVRISGSAAAFANAVLASTTMLYSGEQFDNRIGLQYLRARYYDATTGCFNRLDPFIGNQQDPQSYHKYAYVHGDPITFMDPLGLFPSARSWWYHMWLGARVHQHIGTDFMATATPGNLRWANYFSNETIVTATGGTVPFSGPPFSFKPDLAQYNLATRNLSLYEIKPSDLVMGAPTLWLSDRLIAAAQLTLKYFFPLVSTVPAGVTVTFGRTQYAGIRTWPTFPHGSKGYTLVTWNDYALTPGVILYDFVPNKMRPLIEEAVFVGSVAFAASFIVARLATAATYTTAMSSIHALVGVSQSEKVIRTGGFGAGLAAAAPSFSLAASVFLVLGLEFDEGE